MERQKTKKTLASQSKKVEKLQEQLMIQTIYGGQIDLPEKVQDLNHVKDINFQKMLAEGNKLFFRFTDFHCSSCIEEQAILLKRFAEIVASENIVLLVSTNNIRNIKLVCKDLDLSFHLFNIDYGQISHPAETAEFPYYFVTLTNQIKGSLIFIPDKGIPELVEK
ncbi:hypothetical protein ACFSKL_06035 [Belliella marina]|uniref:AhpC/TSA family protein n=1 Tax=Belliella marina TaxID=1644146 RepID=A0ABW4VLD3_9BACT